MIVAGGEAGQEAKLAVRFEPEHFADGAQENEVVAGRRHADEPPQGLPVRPDRSVAGEDRWEEIGAAREWPILVDVDPKDHRTPVSFFREPAERRRQRRFRPEMGLGARIVDEDQPPEAVEGHGAPPEEMVQPHRHGPQVLVRPESIDAIAVLLAEEEIPAARIHREASQRRLPRLGGEGNHHPGRPRGVHGEGAAHVEAVELRGGVSPPPLAEYHQHPVAVASELYRSWNPRDHDLGS